MKSMKQKLLRWVRETLAGLLGGREKAFNTVPLR